jgi:uncharacterized protein with LGFP repeats
MYASKSTGVHVVWGAVLTRYLAAGGHAVLGAPTTDELAAPDGVGRYNHFQEGVSIYWTPQFGAQLVWGGVQQEWQRTGWEAGALGYPTGAETAIPGGRGTYQEFQFGTIY